MPGWTCPPGNISDPDLDACIALTSAVSYASQQNFADPVASRGRIRDRMNDNSWHTWYYKDNGGVVVACCFFQWMLKRNKDYAMSIGFDSRTFPMLTPADCLSFLNTVLGNGNGDGLFRDCVKNVLGKPHVNIVDVPLTILGQLYNLRLNILFGYMQANAPGSMSLTLQEQNVDDPFWGDGINVWRLKVS